MVNKKTLVLLIVLILISIFLVLLPRIVLKDLGQGGFFYSYPLHTDEWQHYTIAMSLDKDFFQPSVFYYQDYQPFHDGSPLFHWIIFLFQKLGLQAKHFYILTILQAIFFSIVFFLFFTKFFNSWTGFVATLFAFSVESNIRLLGLLFFKPFVLGFAFFILALLFFHKKEHFSFSFIIVGLMSIFCYPPFFLLLIIYVFIYGLINKKFNKNYLFWIILSVSLILLLGWYITGGNLSLLIDKILYKDYWTGQGDQGLIKYLNISLIILGLLGILNTLKDKKLWPYHALFIFFGLNIILMFTTGYSIGFHYVRMVYLGALIFSGYAAIGVWFIFKYLNKRIKKGAILVVLPLVIATIVPTLIFYTNYFSQPGALISPELLTKDNLEALKYLKNYPDKEKKLLHSMEMGTVITPMTGFKVTATSVALTGGKENRYSEIIKSNCEEIKKIINKENYDLLWLHERTKVCPFLEMRFENDSIVIYEYQDF